MGTVWLDISGAHVCWQCGRVTTIGVCMGPHPGYDHLRAVARGFVSDRNALVYDEGGHPRRYNSRLILDDVKPKPAKEAPVIMPTMSRTR